MIRSSLSAHAIIKLGDGVVAESDSGERVKGNARDLQGGDPGRGSDLVATVRVVEETGNPVEVGQVSWVGARSANGDSLLEKERLADTCSSKVSAQRPLYDSRLD